MLEPEIWLEGDRPHAFSLVLTFTFYVVLEFQKCCKNVSEHCVTFNWLPVISTSYVTVASVEIEK